MDTSILLNEKHAAILSHYDVSSKWGFLIDSCSAELPHECYAWEAVMKNLPQLIRSEKSLFDRVKSLEFVDARILTTRPQLYRAYSMLSFVAQAVSCSDTKYIEVSCLQHQKL